MLTVICSIELSTTAACLIQLYARSQPHEESHEESKPVKPVIHRLGDVIWKHSAQAGMTHQKSFRRSEDLTTKCNNIS